MTGDSERDRETDSADRDRETDSAERNRETDDAGRERANAAAVDQRRLVRDGYDELAETYADSRDQDEAELALLEELRSGLDSPEPRILDAGCGDGRAAARPLADRAAVVGLDVSRAQLQLAAETVDVPLVQGELTALPFEPATFDAVCAFHSIIHVPRSEHETVFREFARVLSGGGRLLVSVGEAGWEGANPDWLDGGAEMAWSFHDLEWSRAALADAGFRIADEWSIGDELGDGSWRYLLAVRER